MNNPRILLAEHFYSIQGEGPSTGVPCIFIRLGGCNLLCGRGPNDDRLPGTWECDTIDVWRKGKRTDIAQFVADLDTKYAYALRPYLHFVFTGGEPLLQAEPLERLIETIYTTGLENDCGYQPYNEVETNGTILPSVALYHYIQQWNVSPKLSNSGQPRERRINPEALQFFSEVARQKSTTAYPGRYNRADVWFKFVITDPSRNWDEIHDDFILPFNIPFQNIVLMPAASTQEELRAVAPQVVDLCKDKGVRYSSRAQVEIWDKTTGV